MIPKPMDDTKAIIIENCPEPLSQLKQRELRTRAEYLSSHLQLPVIKTGSENYEFALLVSSQGLSLKMSGRLAPGPVVVDFSSPTFSYRVKDAVNGQAIAKAIGFKRGISLTVLDATAGFGKDAFLLASLGCQVILVERDAIVHALLEDGIRRASLGEDTDIQSIVSRMSLIFGDFKHTPKSDKGIDVVYLDPMFPKRHKTARVKKDMYVLQRLLSSQPKVPDEDSLLFPALDLAGKRVVVKRPKHSACLAGKHPTFVLRGRSSRYDVYITA